MTERHGEMSLEVGMDLSGMTYRQLWLRQVGVGGELGQFEVEAYVLGLLDPPPYEHNVLAQAINEHFIGLGGDHPVAYDNSDSVS